MYESAILRDRYRERVTKCVGEGEGDGSSERNNS